MKVYGPYTRKDGRKHVIVYEFGQKRQTISYSKWLMEQHLGRELTPDETVDHINRDKTDDRIENLRVIKRPQHSYEDTRRVKLVEITCMWCGRKALKAPHDLRGNSKQGKAGPFCGKSCGAKYGREVQLKRIKPFPSQPTVKSEYYYLEKKI
jgi:hypothetical protein